LPKPTKKIANMRNKRTVLSEPTRTLCRLLFSKELNKPHEPDCLFLTFFPVPFKRFSSQPPASQLLLMTCVGPEASQ
jgi:hypothetical protein